MLPAPIADGEDERLKALRALRLLDTPPEQRFDWLVQYAARELVMPIALVSLVDGHRQWFKARIGLDSTETPRDVSFCGHAIGSDDIFIVEDATQDPRFADNPLVTDGLGIRFYAGAPIKSPDGHRVGTLCVIDTEPRRLDAVELQILDALREMFNADMVSTWPDTKPWDKAGTKRG